MLPRLGLASLFIMGSTTLLAGTMGPVRSDYSWFITLTGGPAWALHPGNSQTLQLQPDVIKHYTVEDTNDVFMTGELFVGIARSLTPTWVGQLGLAVGASTNFTIQGDIWEDADPDFNNYFYQYDVSNARVALKGKVLGHFSYWIDPYVSASIGASFNRASNFSITPKIIEEVPAPLFLSNTQTSFTYTVGFGFQKTLAKHFSAGVGYEFTNWGKSQLNKAPGQTLGSGLYSSHLYTQALQFNLTYLV